MVLGTTVPELVRADALGDATLRAAATRRTLLARLSGSVATLAVASACRAGGPAPEGARPAPAFDKEVQIRWTTWGNETHPMVKASTLGVEAFSKHFPKIKVQNQPDPGCAAVTTQFAAGDGPDVAGQCCTCLPEWARAGVTENLDPYIKRDWKKEQIADFAELQFDWFNGRHFNQPELGQYAVPMYMGTPLVVFGGSVPLPLWLIHHDTFPPSLPQNPSSQQPPKSPYARPRILSPPSAGPLAPRRLVPSLLSHPPPRRAGTCA